LTVSSMLPQRPLTLVLVACMASALCACSLSPGMRFQADKPVDSNNPQSIPNVQQITPELVHAQQAAFIAKNGSVRQLLGSPRPYRIGPGDVLSIIAWDHPELVVPNLTYTTGATGGTGTGMASQSIPGFVVGDNGDIQYPYVGDVQAKGLTPAELQAILKKKLASYLANAQITVSVAGYLSKRVFMEGQLAQPGVRPITNVPMSLAEAIGESGGVTSGVGDTSRIQLLRGNRSYQIDLPALARENIDASKIMLMNHDIVRVPPQAYNQVIVAGEVGHPMQVPLHDGRLTLNEALGAAAGVNPQSSEPAAIYVIRATSDPARPDVFKLDSSSPVGLALAEHFELQPKDVIYVDSTGLARWSRVMNLFASTIVTAAQGRTVAQ